MMKSVFFILGCLLRTSVLVPMEFHIYSEENQKGESLRLTKTRTDLACAVNLIGGYNSRCILGAWIYSAEGWTIDNMPKPAFSDSLVCLNPEVVFRNITEVYRVGPADTSTPAISFLHKGALTMVEKKSEAFIDIDQAAVPITYVCTTGSTEWMLFSEKNFAGTSKCFGSNAEQVHCSKPDNATLKGMPTIGSVIRGCHNTN